LPTPGGPKRRRLRYVVDMSGSCRDGPESGRGEGIANVAATPWREAAGL
jgi:hypothetical protein